MNNLEIGEIRLPQLIYMFRWSGELVICLQNLSPADFEGGKQRNRSESFGAVIADKRGFNTKANERTIKCPIVTGDFVIGTRESTANPIPSIVGARIPLCPVLVL